MKYEKSMASINPMNISPYKGSYCLYYFKKVGSQYVMIEGLDWGGFSEFWINSTLNDCMIRLK